MRDFTGRVAVVTGAASGMGRALAECFASEGMKVVLADIERQALQGAVQALKQRRYDVIGIPVDVSDFSSVEELAQRTIEAYGKVHILCNNAGVVADSDWAALHPDRRTAGVWELSLSDWHWTFGVNFWGVVHGIKAFLPMMLQQGEEGHVVNTASVAGLTGGADLAIYSATKHAVVRVSEALYLQLNQMDSPVKVSVLCPGMLATRIFNANRNRPPELSDQEAHTEPVEQRRERLKEIERQFAESMPPSEAAAKVVQAIRDERFYIFTHPQREGAIRTRLENILEGRNPA